MIELLSKKYALWIFVKKNNEMGIIIVKLKIGTNISTEKKTLNFYITDLMNEWNLS